jgi:outer membrane protein OmpA-like peptidoglycan-associated protein
MPPMRAATLSRVARFPSFLAKLCFARSSVSWPSVQALALLAVFAPASALAETDAPGTRDHPMIKRYEGSWILGYQQREYTDFVIPTGPLKADFANQAQPYSVERSAKPEGRHTRIIYVVPQKRATLEVLRNYLEDLDAKGFKRLYACSGAECGPDEGRQFVTHWMYPLASTQKPKNKGQMTEFALNFPDDVRYVAYWLDRPEGAVYVALTIAENKFNQWPETFDKVMVLMDVVEVGRMERRMVDPQADEMKRGLDQNGRVALYGIQFDFNKAEIKRESAATLGEIAKLLKANPVLKLYVVGHTDAVGAVAYNKDLSEKRAVAVVQWLVRQQGIAADRLTPAGVGPLAPVATNATEEGRAKNRRVELVVRP